MPSSFRRRAVLKAALAAPLIAAPLIATPLIVGRRASAADRSITVGTYTAQQGEYVRKQIIPPFEAKHGCRVFTTQGVTLEQIALLRATRGNPRYSVMFMDDIGIQLAKGEGLIEQLPAEQIPNHERLLKRFTFYDGYGFGFAMSAAGLVYNTQSGKPLTSYGELWEPRFAKRYLMETPKTTQSLYLLIAALTVETGKPYKETQYLIEQAWPKMEKLKPSVLSIYDNPSTVMQIAQGQADIAGIEYSKNVFPYTVKGAPIDMCYPKEGTFAGINCLSLVKNAPDRELGIAFIDWMLDPTVQQGLAAATYTAPTISGLTFDPAVAKYLAYPETRMEELGIFTGDWSFINPLRPKLLEKYNQVFGT